MTLLYFILAISVLVVVHEYGHFWVARRCGVRVLRFSVGFGKPLWSFRDKHGTEFAIAPIPLGGYVSMLDEREAPVPEELLDQAFNRKTPWQRMAIAVAGPLANFIFAIIAYWALFLAGTTGLVPVVGNVAEESPAYVAGIRSGDEIIRVAGKTTATWEDVNWQLIRFIGEDAHIEVGLKAADGAEHQATIKVQRWLSGDEIQDPLSALGLMPRRLDIPAILGQLNEGGAAQQASLQTGDKLLTANGEPIADWYQWVELIRQSANTTLAVEVLRGEQVLTLQLTPAARTDEQGQVSGFIGAMVQIPTYPDSWLRERQLGVWDSLVQGINKTYDTIAFTLESLWKMLAGDVSVKNLSGPVTIAKVAGSSGANGIIAFVGFLALLSVSLGVLNLLPIPVLDGGHILFCIAEVLRGKPLSAEVQVAAVKIGMFLLLCLMLVAFYNDLSRL